MELAIPLIALGGMYIVSNQTPSKSCDTEKGKTQKINQENFTSMGVNRNYLPNTNTPPQNFPVSNINQLIRGTEPLCSVVCSFENTPGAGQDFRQ